MRIAVIGSGIGGLSAAWLLSRRHEVVLYEANDYLGGHTDTHRVEVDGRMLDVDTGFIVHNPANYPLLTRMFAELGVASQATTMGFSVQDERTGLEYNATSLDALFCQRRNLASPRFWGMLRDLVRFYREAPALLDLDGPGPTLGEYLDAVGVGMAAEVVVGLVQHDLVPTRQQPRRGQATDPAADHRDAHQCPAFASTHAGTGLRSRTRPSACSSRSPYHVKSNSHQKNPWRALPGKKWWLLCHPSPKVSSASHRLLRLSSRVS